MCQISLQRLPARAIQDQFEALVGASHDLAHPDADSGEAFEVSG